MIVTRDDGRAVDVSEWDARSEAVRAWLAHEQRWSGPTYEVGSNAGCPADRYLVRDGDLMEVVIDSIEGHPCGWHLEPVPWSADGAP